MRAFRSYRADRAGIIVLSLAADFSKAHVGQAIDVKIAGKSVTKPVIREPITGGVISIAVLSIDEGQQLAARLSSKAAKLDVEVAQ